MLFKFVEVSWSICPNAAKTSFFADFRPVESLKNPGLVQAEYHSEEVGFIASLGIEVYGLAFIGSIL